MPLRQPDCFAASPTKMFTGHDMTNTKHTPGPWYWEGGNIENLVGRLFGEGGQKIIDSAEYENMWFSQYGPADDANARLIAAAPDLLDALEGIVERGDPAWSPVDFCIAHEAIAKAKGGAS